MSSKSAIYLFMFIGSTIGGFIPMIWGDMSMGMSAVIFGAIGGIGGIYVGYKINH